MIFKRTLNGIIISFITLEVKYSFYDYDKDYLISRCNYGKIVFDLVLEGVGNLFQFHHHIQQRTGGSALGS